MLPAAMPANRDLCLVTQFQGSGSEWVAQLNGTMVDAIMAEEAMTACI